VKTVLRPDYNTQNNSKLAGKLVSK